MTTALQMIKTAARRTGFLAAGETLPANESADALEVLNTMLDAWAINRLMVYTIKQEVLAISANTASYTIGTGGTWNTTRPVKLDDSSFLRISNIDYPITLIDAGNYAGIPVKGNLATIAYAMACDYDYPLATISIYPTPSASGSIYLRSWEILQAFSTLTTDLALPRGYQRAIEWNLTKELCPEYGKAVTSDIMREAANSKAAIATINAPSTLMKCEVALNNNQSPGNIYQG